MKNSKGITLVALVVTIIVLLILAGVSLSLVAGGNGILTRASNAADTNYNKSAQEAAELLIAQATTEYYEVIYAGGTSSIANADQLALAKASLPAYVYYYVQVNNEFTGGTINTTYTTTTKVVINVTQTNTMFNAEWNGTVLGAWNSGS